MLPRVLGRSLKDVVRLPKEDRMVGSRSNRSLALLTRPSTLMSDDPMFPDDEPDEDTEGEE